MLPSKLAARHDPRGSKGIGTMRKEVWQLRVSTGEAGEQIICPARVETDFLEMHC